MADQPSKPSEPLVQLPAIEKLEEEIKSEFYELRDGKIWFSEEIKREHRRLKTSLVRYVLHSRIMAILTAPFIYAVIIPFVLLDLFVSVYQAVCFPVYGVPKARRRDYIALDRKRLRYLNALEGIKLPVLLLRKRRARVCRGNRGANRAALVPDPARAARSERA